MCGKGKHLTIFLKKDERGPPSIRWTLEPFQRQNWQNIWDIGYRVECIYMGFCECTDTILYWSELKGQTDKKDVNKMLNAEKDTERSVLVLKKPKLLSITSKMQNLWFKDQNIFLWLEKKKEKKKKKNKQVLTVAELHSTGAVWKWRWPSWAPRS